jgi:hypothetical protein
VGHLYAPFILVSQYIFNREWLTNAEHRAEDCRVICQTWDTI